jgi:predicted permease
MRLYDLLLHLYPAAFRNEYGEEMRAIFARRQRQARGPLATLALGTSTLFEVVVNALAVHRDILRQDLRYTARTLLSAPGFTLTAILVVALGVGANTAVFTVTDFVLIRPLPFSEPDRLVKLYERLPGYTRMELAPVTYRDWKRMSHSFEAMGAFINTSVNLVGQGDPERLEASSVSSDVFPLLGSQPLAGRLFNSTDDRIESPGTVLLSYGLWQTMFGADLGVIGRKVVLDGTPLTVIGVTPRDFHFPDRNAELWTPLQVRDDASFEDRNNNYFGVIARLRRGVTVEQARSEMAVIAAQLRREYPKAMAQHGATVNPLREELSESSRMLLVALSGAAICVLLIACANLASLLLARGLARRKELAVRTALGAGRERLVRQLVTESLVLAVLGGVPGVLGALSSIPLLAKLVPASLPIAQAPTVDWRVLTFAVLLTLLTGIAFGVIPALRTGGSVDLGGLRDGVRAGGGRRERMRSALVIAEVMASVVLLVSSGLLMRALWRLQSTDPGFRTDGVLTMRTALPWPKYLKTSAREEFYKQVLTGIRELPGVSSAAYITVLPMVWRGGIWPVSIDQQILDRAESNSASVRFVTPGVFGTLGIPLHLGRDVEEADTSDMPFVAVVSQSFVRRYWPNENPLGKHFQFGFHDRMVVGVVGDVRVRGLERPSEPQVYLPYQQVPNGYLFPYTPKDLVVKSSTTAGLLLPAIRRIVQSADREQPISDVRMMSEIVEGETASRALQLRILGAFAVVAILLAGIGIHGLLSFAVSQRLHEIGVRMALGASSGDVLRMVLRQGVALAAAGVVLGVILAYAAGREMEALLAGVKPADALTFLTAIGLCGLMTLLGSLLPAARAVRVDPIAVIRSE